MIIGETPPVERRAGWTVSFASTVNALSIPLIAGILIWLLDRVLSPDKWCPALEEFKSAQAAGAAVLRCLPVLIQQLKTGHVVAVSLVAALSLSHLVSVIREAKAGFGLNTKFGSLSIGGDAAEGAKHVREAAEGAEAEIKEGTA